MLSKSDGILNSYVIVGISYRCLLDFARCRLASTEDQTLNAARRVVVRLGGKLLAVDKLTRHVGGSCEETCGAVFLF